MQAHPEIVQYRLENWREFYSRQFSLRAELNADIVPPTRPGLDRLIVVVPGIHPDKVIRAMRQFLHVRTHGSEINRHIVSNERNGSEFPYAIWVADEDHTASPYERRTAEWINNQNVHTETLLEYLLHFFKAWDETRRTLNYARSTVCTGTQLINNCTPRIKFDQAKEQLEIIPFARDLELGNMSPREVIAQLQD